MTVLVSRITVEQDIVELLSRLDAQTQLLPVPIAATATAADTTSIRSTTLDRGNPSASAYDGMLVKIVSSVQNGPAVGEVSRVITNGYDGSDQITVSPPFSAVVQNSQQFMLYPLRWAPEAIVSAIAAVLRQTRGPHIWAPSLISDSDMNDNDLTNWAAVGTPTTREFVASSADVLFGPRSLHLVSDALDEGATSNSLPVTETEELIAWVPVRVISGSVAVIARNVTAGSDLETLATVDEPLFTAVYKQFSVEDDTHELALRFLSAAASSEWYVSPHVIVQSANRRSYAVPTWLKSGEQIVNVLELSSELAGEASDSYIALSARLRPLPGGASLIRSDLDVNQARLSLANPTSRPIFLEVMREFSELTSELAQTPCDRDFLAYRAVAKLLKERGDGNWRGYKQDSDVFAARLGYSQPRLRVRESPERAI